MRLVFGILIAVILASFVANLGSRTGTPPDNGTAAAVATTAPPRSEQLASTIEDVKSTALVGGLQDENDLFASLAIIQLWASVADRPTTTEDEKAKRQELLTAISAAQRKALPALRDAYGPIMRQALWIEDGSARTIGEGFRTVEFVAAEFAANRNVKRAQEAAHEMLMKLRFTRAQFKWFKEASEYQYYTLEPPRDGDVVIWNGSSFRVLE